MEISEAVLQVKKYIWFYWSRAMSNKSVNQTRYVFKNGSVSMNLNNSCNEWMQFSV